MNFSDLPRPLGTDAVPILPRENLPINPFEGFRKLHETFGPIFGICNDTADGPIETVSLLLLLT